MFSFEIGIIPLPFGFGVSLRVGPFTTSRKSGTKCQLLRCEPNYWDVHSDAHCGSCSFQTRIVGDRSHKFDIMIIIYLLRRRATHKLASAGCRVTPRLLPAVFAAAAAFGMATSTASS